jgi:hypothetical protein
LEEEKLLAKCHFGTLSRKSDLLCYARGWAMS